MAKSSAKNGKLTFSAESQKSVVFAEPLSGADYIVILSSMLFSPIRVTNKTINGFTVQTGAAVTGIVGWDLFT